MLAKGNATAVDCRLFLDGLGERVLSCPRLSRRRNGQSTRPTARPELPGEDDTCMIAGQPWSEQAFPSTTLPKVSPEYFRALGVPLRRGRFFNQDDTAQSAPVTIISDSLARRYFAGKDPIGQKVRASGPGNPDPYMSVVGVVGDVKYWPESEFAPAYYRPYTQNFNTSIFVIVRSPQPAAGLANTIQREIRALDKDAVVRRVLTLEDLLGSPWLSPASEHSC
jgi:putative ABC transport system permease protein